MAYRDPKTYLCPSCGTREDVHWIVGVNLSPDRNGDDWRKQFDPKSTDLFTVETTQSRDTWQGTITCNTCQTVIKDTRA
ncbi:hypothetical protein [Yoonia sp. 208BN28-4]|uniref:hypothetical protein n=1 Tax=Yoonia sp. 208BN28-4 TaxID=3126505 RepID=UPI0030A77609